MGLDALLVLGGEGTDRPRSHLALNLYHQAAEEKKPHIITAGWCSGLLDPAQRPDPKTHSHAAQMANFLVENGVPESDISTENRSLDSIGNYVYSRGILRWKGACSVGIIVDQVELRRATRTSNWVWGDEFDVTMLSISGEDDYSTLREAIVDYTTMLDHFFLVVGPRRLSQLCGKEPKAREDAWQQYMNRWHPFHATGIERFFTAYGAGVLATKCAQYLGRNLPKDLRETN